MDHNQTILRSAIIPSTMQHTLWRGTILGIAGAACLLVPGIFMPLDVMQVWGFPLFIAGIGLIAFGLIPYRKLKKLEENPNRIILEETSIGYAAGGKLLFTLPVEAIDRVAFLENTSSYGICITLKSPLPAKLRGEDSRFDLVDFRAKSLSKHGCDLFLPYFSRRAFETLTDYLDST